MKYINKTVNTKNITMTYKKYKFLSHLFATLAILISLSCSNDDDLTGNDPFYGNALTSANVTNLHGTWAIFEVEFDGLTVAVPPTYESCGRDFVLFSEGGLYKEFLIANTSCIPDVNELDWVLDNGVITLKNSLGQTQEMVIVALTPQIFVFKAKLDIDEDGKLDILTFTARRYQPEESVGYTGSIYMELDYANPNEEIKLKWQPYVGYNNFDRYEIYRSETCNESDKELIATINNIDQDFFVDETPPVSEEICYSYKIFTDQGLLGESYFTYLNTSSLEIAAIAISEPIVAGNTIEVNWAKSESLYFSHYEITVRNFISGSGYNYYEEPLTTIYDRETTQFIDASPPYFMNPVYHVDVYDIFGNKSDFSSEVTSSRAADFSRPEILDFDIITSTAIDNDDTILYFYGRTSTYGNFLIKRYNYATNTVEAIADDASVDYTQDEIKFIQSANGKEIIVPFASEINIYNAANLEFKYELDVTEATSLDDFAYLGNDLWVFVDSKNVYTYTRDNANLTLINKVAHFDSYQSGNKYHLIVLENNQILIGHYNEPNSISFKVDSQGLLTEKSTVGIPVKSEIKKKTIYNKAQNYLVNLLENRVYSTESFTYLKSFETPYYPSGMSSNGLLMLGTNNDPDWFISDDSLHKKEALTFNLSTQMLHTYETIGYPHFLFENHLGQVISVSSGVKRKDLYGSAQRPDLFVEIIY